MIELPGLDDSMKDIHGEIFELSKIHGEHWPLFHAIEVGWSKIYHHQQVS
jgi:hypothetical protein